MKQNPLHPKLLELAEEIVNAGDIRLTTERGAWDDTTHLELDVTWTQADGFSVQLTRLTVAAHYPATLYQPAETDWNEDYDSGNFVKIRDFAQWVNGYGFNLVNVRKDSQ